MTWVNLHDKRVELSYNVKVGMFIVDDSGCLLWTIRDVYCGQVDSFIVDKLTALLWIS